jgi:hypothetical protein
VQSKGSQACAQSRNACKAASIAKINAFIFISKAHSKKPSHRGGRLLPVTGNSLLNPYKKQGFEQLKRSLFPFRAFTLVSYSA